MATATLNQRISTPWGTSDYASEHSPGIVFYGTPSHGGFKVTAEVEKCIPPDLRTRDRWYEEDCEWAILCVNVPGFVTKGGTADPEIQRKVMAEAKALVATYYPTGLVRHYHG